MACPEKTKTESTSNCCNFILVEGGKPHRTSYQGCSHAKNRTAKEKSRMSSEGISGRTLFSKFTSPEQSYAAALRQDTQHQQPQATQTDNKTVGHPVQQHPLQDEIHESEVGISGWQS
jgi:hypothetical protein